MADITMCPGHGCPMKQRCYRFTAPVTEHWQAYFAETPRTSDLGCTYFWPNEDYPTKQKGGS
jgi:hypothetical protein